MSNTLYLECNAGISGDMTVAALLDLGASEEVLDKALKSLLVDGFKTVIKRVKKSGLDACDFNVVLDGAHENHDHDMAYLHGKDGHAKTTHSHEAAAPHAHSHEAATMHAHSHEAAAPHAHSHEAAMHTHTHPHRGLADILAIIDQADMTPKAKEIATRIFSIIAKAEGKVHGLPMEEVHFHEVGAVDSIVDIVAVAVCLDNLDMEDVIVSPLAEGSGTIRCQHGIIPVPVPAVTAIVAEHEIALEITGISGELVTPTGAAIVAAIKTRDQLPRQMKIKKVGLGAGKRQYERPSLLRAMIVEETTEKHDYIYKLESNIDDCTGECLGYVMEKLLEAGARDVHYIPVFMKKNRPAYELTVICAEEDIAKLENIIFTETTTIGIRRMKMQRSVLKRQMKEIETSLGKVQVKICETPEGARYYPEYSSIASICRNQGLSYQKVYMQLLAELGEK